MSPLYKFLNENRALTDRFPGNKFEGDLAGHGPEWTAELLLYTEKRSGDDDLFYTLNFELMEDAEQVNGKPLVALLVILVTHAEEGCVEKAYIPFSDEITMLAKICEQAQALEVPPDTRLPQELAETLVMIRCMMEQFSAQICFKEL